MRYDKLRELLHVDTIWVLMILDEDSTKCKVEMGGSLKKGGMDEHLEWNPCAGDIC